MNAYRVTTTIPENHVLILPNDIPSGPAEVLVLMSESHPAHMATGGTARPIWEVFEDLMKEVPEDVLASLPVDGAEQHDHYIYGIAKR